MKILNLHGYNGQPSNTNYEILTELGYPVGSPQLNYGTEDPNKIVEYLSNYIKDWNIDLIVATSFGAFFGKILSLKYNIPLIATNPCLSPDVSLIKIAPEYFSDDKKAQFIFDNVEKNDLAGYKGNVFIVGTKDEIVDPKLTYVQAYNARIYKVANGHHQLNIDSYRRILEKEVDEIYVQITQF